MRIDKVVTPGRGDGSRERPTVTPATEERVTTRRKLIEVALPLEAINKQSAREKSIRHGHPSTLHLWWARRPLATARAVLFAQLVDDPSAREDEFRDEAIRREETDVDSYVERRVVAERERLFDLITRMVDWDNLNDEALFDAVRAEIMRSRTALLLRSSTRSQAAAPSH